MRPINPDHRLPTLLYVDERTGQQMNSNIPIYPQPSIFETTVAITSTGVVDHTEVERVMARPPWDFEEANYRIYREALERRNEEFRAGLAREQAEREQAAKPKPPAKKAPAKKAAAKKTTAKKSAPAKKAAPKPSTRKRSS